MQTRVKAQGRDLVLVNEAEPADQMPDVVAIIASLCARRAGRRRAGRKKTQ
jgi:predicted site-specific integrase-resolvase